MQNISKYVEREIINHMKLRHPHIIALREVFLTTDHLVLVMEYAAGGDLFTYVSARRGLTEDEARWFFQQLMVGVDYCHRMGVASRDIKLENTLLDGSPRPLIKLADFGFSKDETAQSAPQSRVGTPAYLSPEVILSDARTPYDGKQADVWSCGVLLYILVTGSYPFQRAADLSMKGPAKLNAVLTRILAVDYIYSPSRVLSDECRDLIDRMLVKDPQQRATVSEIQRHPWYAKSLSPAALGFNDAIMAEAAAHPPSASIFEDVRSIVAEARTLVREPDLSDGEALEHGVEQMLRTASEADAHMPPDHKK